MKKYMIFFSVILLATLGCTRVAKDKQILAKVNNYEITQEEFEEEFKESALGRIDTLESRKEFLNNLINRKLILQDAQRENLDKQKSFLKMIEKFWEQSLLKLVLDTKAKEITGIVQVSDKDIEKTYQNMLQDGKADKPYNQMYQQIKWELTKLKETQAMDDWVAQLHKKADIKINYDLLKQANKGD